MKKQYIHPSLTIHHVVVESVMSSTSQIITQGIGEGSLTPESKKNEPNDLDGELNNLW